MRSRGAADSIFVRTSSITSWLERLRSFCGVRRATMSPVFCSVANSPSSAPVRREIPATSGVASRMRSAMCTCRSVSTSAVPPGVK